MAYVRRDSTGKIIAYSQSEQPEGSGYVFCPDDDPELVERNRQINAGYTPPTPEELSKIRAEHAAIEKEHEELKQFTTIFGQLFSELELALGNLLAEIIHKPSSRIAHAIYYSPTGFHARSELVGNALLQLVIENREKLSSLEGHWEKIDEKIVKVRQLRNAIAHSSQITQQISGTLYARLSPPAFDVIRIDRVLARRQIPGLSVHDIKVGVARVGWVRDRVDEVNRLVTAFRADSDTLLERFRELEFGLQAEPRPIVGFQKISAP